MPHARIVSDVSSIENQATTVDTLPAAMRLIAQINDPEERGRVRTLLEDNGIPVFQQQGYRDPGAKATFVCIASQYDDAIALLANPNHEVREPVDVQGLQTLLTLQDRRNS